MPRPDGVKHWEGPGLEAWKPWTPWEAARRLDGCAASWCVVGGWALDLWRGEQTRPHEDLEIAIPRSDFALVRDQLAEFRLCVVGDGEVRALATGAVTPPDRRQNWVLDEAAQAWRMDVMLEPGDAATWIYRRDERLIRPRAAMVGVTTGGVPYLRPEGALFYKAKSPRPKDQADFDGALSLLDAESRAWLRSAIEQFHPGHAWLSALA